MPPPSNPGAAARAAAQAYARAAIAAAKGGNRAGANSVSQRNIQGTIIDKPLPTPFTTITKALSSGDNEVVFPKEDCIIHGFWLKNTGNAACVGAVEIQDKTTYDYLTIGGLFTDSLGARPFFYSMFGMPAYYVTGGTRFNVNLKEYSSFSTVAQRITFFVTYCKKQIIQQRKPYILGFPFAEAATVQTNYQNEWNLPKGVFDLTAISGGHFVTTAGNSPRIQNVQYTLSIGSQKDVLFEDLFGGMLFNDAPNNTHLGPLSLMNLGMPNFKASENIKVDIQDLYASYSANTGIVGFVNLFGVVG